MLTFSSENPSRLVATSCVAIVGCATSIPMVWTREHRPVTTRRIYIVCSQTRAGHPALRVYPLQRDPTKPPPAFVIVPHAHPLANDEGTHLVLRHDNFLLIRPLVAIYYRARWAVRRREVVAPELLLTLVRHCYLRDLIDDEFVAQVEKKFDKLSALIARAEGTNFEGEREAASLAVGRVCLSVLEALAQALSQKKGVSL
jgi:hypothetical protein